MNSSDSPIKPKKEISAHPISGDRIWGVYIIFSALALIFSIIFTSILYEQRLQEQYVNVVDTGNRLVSALDHELYVMTVGVVSMVSMAEDFLIGRTDLTFNPSDCLIAIPEKGGYSLGVPPGYNSDQIGNLTGIGEIPRTNSSTENEMSMAISLTPVFKTIAARNTFIPWVYYTSAQDFLYVYPRVGVDGYFYSKRLKDMDFFGGATPENNPDRSVFWTPVYMDEAGAGLMVTVSKPVYLDDQFLGSISSDIVVKALSWLLESYPIPNSTAHLIGTAGETIVNPIGLEDPIDFTSIMPRTPTEYGEYMITVFPLQTVNWYIVIKTQRQAMKLVALKQSAQYGLIVLFLFCNLILVAILYRTLRRLWILSIQDSLTGLNNRRSFDEISQIEFTRLRRTGGYLGFAILDIDFFKSYNDNYGHKAGDTVLRDMSQMLTTTLRRSSDRLFRIGGEEFAILVILETPDQMAPLMECICQAVQLQNIPHQGSPFGNLTITIGAIIISGFHWMDVDSAFQKADQALYRAKDRGRNRVELDISEI